MRAADDDQNLPSLGDRSSSLVSLQEEHQIGQQFLRSLRAQVKTVDDPVLQDYLEHLVYRLVVHSEVQDRRLTIVIIDSKEMNAFAAPGGIVGVNDGIFLYADTDDELAAILAHELGHLSQRHFARQADESKQASIPSLAGLLAGVVLMATTGTDAGLAAITAGQAAGQQEMLRFSRAREAEADRAGIQTLEGAGMDPRAMAYMFEKLQRISRFQGNNVPEFLMTHPVTKDRISDAYNLTRDYPMEDYPPDLDFQMMRARTIVKMSDSVQNAILKMRDGLNEKNPVVRAGYEYGLALALSEAERNDEAMKYIKDLEKDHPGKIALTVAEANIDSRAEDYAKANAILKQALDISPENYPLTMTYARTLVKVGKAKEAEQLLVPLTTKRPQDDNLWYLLAETYGLANNIVGVHEARAEYFVLVGNMKQAITQLGYALPLVKHNFQETAKIRTRIEQIAKLEQQEKKGL
ncbi:MAG TPA: M48 family metalloprotease [Pseudomonadales bacterium]|nr:M48 family metalloprotease [Pseudomonadales bacterium]